MALPASSQAAPLLSTHTLEPREDTHVGPTHRPAFPSQAPTEQRERGRKGFWAHGSYFCVHSLPVLTQTLLILLTGYRKQGAPILPDVQQKAEGRGGLSRPCRTRGPRRPAWERGVLPGPRGGWGGVCGGDVQGDVLGSPSSV